MAAAPRRPDGRTTGRGLHLAVEDGRPDGQRFWGSAALLGRPSPGAALYGGDVRKEGDVRKQAAGIGNDSMQGTGGGLGAGGGLDAGGYPQN